MKKNKTSEKTIEGQQIGKGGLAVAPVVAAMTLVLGANSSANAQTTNETYTNAKNTEQVHQTQQNYDYLFSNAEKLFDMYCLAYNINNFGSMVSEKEKAKCQEFFLKHPKLKEKCMETNKYLHNNRGQQGFNNAALAAIRQGNSSLRAGILDALSKDTKALEEINKIKLNNTCLENISEDDKLAAQIWIMYVKVETENAPKSYKEFFEKHPEIAGTCDTAANKLGLTKDMLSTSTIADINAELMLNNQTLGPVDSKNLTEELVRKANNYQDATGKTLELPSSTYVLTTSDLMQMNQSQER